MISVTLEDRKAQNEKGNSIPEIDGGVRWKHHHAR